MDKRTEYFLAWTNLSARNLFAKIASNLEPRVLYVAIPLNSLPPDSEPVVEHLKFPEPCWDGAFLDDLRGLGCLDDSAESAKLVRDRIHTAIGRCAGADQLTHFCSSPRTIDGYTACVLLQLDKSAYDSIPRLPDFPHPYRDRPGPLSLLDEAVEGYLSECHDELANADTNPFKAVNSPTEALWRAGLHTTARVVEVTKKRAFSEAFHLFPACTAIASAQYEKRDSIGSIIVSSREHPHVESVVTLLEPVPIEELRTSRKLLQLSTDNLSLLSDGVEIYGAGKITRGYDPETKNLFTIIFSTPGTWEMWHHEQPLMIVSHEQPRLPAPDFPEVKMQQHLARLFGNLGQEAQRNLCSLARAACDQKHGTTFIISSGASQEAERLQDQCFRLIPLRLTPALLPSLTDIDGAVLVDVDATCHAIGVILDGRVGLQGTVHGDRARGARYNSALRYAADERCPQCLIIVRSEDGMLNFIPGGETQSAGGRVEPT